MAKKSKKEIISNKKFLILTIIATLTMIITVAGVTYAFFAGMINSSNVVNASVTMPSTYSFTSLSGNDMVIDLSSSEMLESLKGNIAATNNASISAQLYSGSDTDTTTCTYDVVFKWDSEDIYTTPDKTLSSGEYEFSVQEGSVPLNEIDLSSYTFTNNETILFSDSISSSSTTKPKVKTYEIKFSIHNIDADQTNIEGKEFAGHIQIVNVNCDVTSGTNGATPLSNGDYTGYYADVDDDGKIDGVIFFDYTQGADTTEGFLGEGVAVSAVTSGLNTYGLKTIGDIENVVVPITTEANDRFYVIDIEDTKPTSGDDKAYWYYNGLLVDKNFLTSSSFGTGKTNTSTMKAAWKNKTYGEQNNRDLWTIDMKDKFVLSNEEWLVLGSNLKKVAGDSDTYESMTFESGASLSFNYEHWSSTLYTYTDDVAWIATFYYSELYPVDVYTPRSVRLAQTF